MYIYPEGGTCMKCPCQHFAPPLSSSDNSPSPTDICAVCPCAAGYHKHSTVASEPATTTRPRLPSPPTVASASRTARPPRVPSPPALQTNIIPRVPHNQPLVNTRKWLILII